MSRDLTPKEIHHMSKSSDIDYSKLIDTMKIIIDGKKFDMYNDKTKAIAHTYPTLSIFGLDFLIECKNLGITSSDIGKELLSELDNYFSTSDIKNLNVELIETAKQWYEGNLCPGYDLTYNNIEFAEYIKTLIKEKGE